MERVRYSIGAVLLAVLTMLVVWHLLMSTV